MAADRLMVFACFHVLVGDFKLKRLAGPVETGEAALRNGGGIAVDIGDGAVALFVDVADQALHAVHIVGHYGGAVIKIVVEGDHGDLGENQLLNQGIVEIRADDGDAVYTAVERMKVMS